MLINNILTLFCKWYFILSLAIITARKDHRFRHLDIFKDGTCAQVYSCHFTFLSGNGRDRFVVLIIIVTTSMSHLLALDCLRLADNVMIWNSNRM